MKKPEKSHENDEEAQKRKVIVQAFNDK